jgi:hypothetical protein
MIAPAILFGLLKVQTALPKKLEFEIPALLIGSRKNKKRRFALLKVALNKKM